MAALALLLIGGASYDVLRIKHDLEAGQRGLSDLSLRAINEGGGLQATVDAAAERISQAEARSRTSPFLTLLRPIPLVGGQVRAIRDLSRAANQIGSIAEEAAARVEGDLDAAGGEPSARLDLLDTAETELHAVAKAVKGIDVGAGGWLVGPLAGARTKLTDNIDQVDEKVAEGTTYVRALRSMLAGPANYLILAANNAEMRAGAGMPLSAGTVHIENGDIEASDFTPTGDPKLLVQARRPLIPEDLRRTYSRFALGHDFRETAASPNFPALGPIYSDMAARSTLGPVAGIFQVDAIALSTLLDAIGPVSYEGVTYDASNVAQQVLNENYLRFSNGDLRADRVDLQSRVAVAIFDALKERDVPVTKLAAGLAEAAKGRHLLAWSPEPDLQALWRKLRATGELNPHGIMVCAENTAANKLDWYIEPKVSIDVRPNQDHTFYKGRITVTIANPALERVVNAVEGNDRDGKRALHRTLLAIYLPTSAVNIHSVEVPFTDAGTDGPMKVAGMRFEIDRGTSRTVSITFDMPLSQSGALLLPSGRVRPVEYEVNGTKVTDAEPTPIGWGG